MGRRKITPMNAVSLNMRGFYKRALDSGYQYNLQEVFDHVAEMNVMGKYAFGPGEFWRMQNVKYRR